MKLNTVVLALFIALIVVSGCSSKKDVKKSLEEIRTGTDAINAYFLANNPPIDIHVEKTGDDTINTFPIVLQVFNKGAYPQPEDGNMKFGKVYLSGYDTNIIKITPKEASASADYGDLTKMAVEGKSTINPNGGQDILSFIGTVISANLNVERYEPTLRATACYYYETVAGPSVCIDPNPYSTTGERKVCEVHDTSLSSQGAPVAVVSIEEQAFARKTQFKITIRNLGKGDVLKEDAAQSKCNPIGTEKIDREDIDKVKLESVMLANTPLDCGPFTGEPAGSNNVKSSSGLIRLINGEGYVICELSDSSYSNKVSSYTSPLLIKLSYGYRTIDERPMLVKLESSS